MQTSILTFFVARLGRVTFEYFSYRAGMIVFITKQ
jgi:hypothetical protein